MAGSQHATNVSIDARLSALCTKIDAEEKLNNERDKRYDERDKSNKEAVKTALVNAEKASDKTESALKEYKVASNEWRDTVKDLVSRMPTRMEIESHIKNLDDKITRLTEEQKTLRSTSEERSGKGAGLNAAWGYLIQIMTLLGALGIGIFIERK